MQRNFGNAAVVELLLRRQVQRSSDSSTFQDHPSRNQRDPDAAFVDYGLTEAPRAGTGDSPGAPSGVLEPEAEVLATGPSDESTMIEDGPGGQAGSTSESGSGPALGAIARQEARLVAEDSLAAEAAVRNIAATNRERIGSEFGGVRRGLSALLARSTATVWGFVTSKQQEVRALSAGILDSARQLVGSATQAAQAQGDQVRETVNGFVEGITTSLAGAVQGIVGQITGVIDHVSLPAIPGVAQLRAAARNLVGRAAGAVTGGLEQVRGLIGSALRAGMQLLGSLLAAFGRAVTAALTRAASGIQRWVGAIVQSLGQVAITVVRAVSAVLNSSVLPMVNRIEGRLAQALGKAEQQAIAAIRTNRDQHLPLLASAPNGAADAGAGAGASAPPEAAAALQATAQEALQNNRMIVQTFEQRTASVLGSIFQALSGGAARIVQQIGGVIAQAISAVLTKVQEITQGLGRVAGAVASFVQSLLQDLGTALAGVVQSVRAIVQDPADALRQFAAGAWSRITGFAGRLVRNLLSGDFGIPSLADVIGVFSPTAYSGGPITKPRPGPITLPALRYLLLALAVVGALVLYAVPQLAAVVSALIALGLSPVAALVVLGAAAILLLILLLLLIFLLLRSKPKRPAPKIAHETDFAAPDGSPKSRADVGVGERVVFTGSAAGAWTASAGSPTSGSGPSFTWTAPERAGSVTITLMVRGDSASASLNVLEPDSITGIKLSEMTFPNGTQGAGMILNFSFNPLKVSFGNAESREVSGPASAITGYYLKHGMPHDHNAGPIIFFRIGPDNKFAAARDRAAQAGYPAPWDAGSFHWLIPNKFRVITESGDGKEYTTVKQEFTMEGPSGKTKITKAGAEVERTP